MSDDRPQTGELQMMQRLIHRRRNRIVGKLYQQVVLLVQREAAGKALYLLQVLKAQVKVASGGEDQASFDASLHFLTPQVDQFGNECMLRMRVRRGNHVRNAV